MLVFVEENIWIDKILYAIDFTLCLAARLKIGKAVHARNTQASDAVLEFYFYSGSFVIIRPVVYIFLLRTVCICFC